jgi:hypothetical protein
VPVPHSPPLSAHLHLSKRNLPATKKPLTEEEAEARRTIIYRIRDFDEFDDLTKESFYDIVSANAPHLIASLSRDGTSDHNFLRVAREVLQIRERNTLYGRPRSLRQTRGEMRRLAETINEITDDQYEQPRNPQAEADGFTQKHSRNGKSK